MRKWPLPIKSWSPEAIQKYCVQNREWQVFRESLKGESTEDKLAMLNMWRYDHLGFSGPLPDEFQCQIDNYLNALKRGGLLNAQLEVIR